MRYNFPPHKDAETIELKAIADKILEEAKEFAQAVEQGDMEQADLECGDLMHACETRFRRRERQGLYTGGVVARVIAKNRARGYYTKD